MANLDKSPKQNKRQKAIQLKNKLMSNEDLRNNAVGKVDYGSSWETKKK